MQDVSLALERASGASCSARTAPARPRCSICWPASCGRIRARSGSPAATSPRCRSTPARGSASPAATRRNNLFPGLTVGGEPRARRGDRAGPGGHGCWPTACADPAVRRDGRRGRRTRSACRLCSMRRRAHRLWRAAPGRGRPRARHAPARPADGRADLGRRPRHGRGLPAAAGAPAARRSTILIIEHDMDLAFGIADVVTVLDHGEVVFEGPPEAARASPLLSEIYLGSWSGRAEVEELQAGYGETRVIHGLSLAVQPGGVLAVLGRNGAGKTTTLKAVMGLVPLAAGRIAFEGRASAGGAPTRSPMPASPMCRRRATSSPRSPCARTSSSPRAASPGPAPPGPWSSACSSSSRSSRRAGTTAAASCRAASSRCWRSRGRC